MKTIRIKRGADILMTFFVKDNERIVLDNLVKPYINEICRKRYVLYNDSRHAVSYWFINLFSGNVAYPFSSNTEFVCKDNMDFDMGMCISSLTSHNSAPLYFMNNIN